MNIKNIPEKYKTLTKISQIDDITFTCVGSNNIQAFGTFYETEDNFVLIFLDNNLISVKGPYFFPILSLNLINLEIEGKI